MINKKNFFYRTPPEGQGTVKDGSQTPSTQRQPMDAQGSGDTPNGGDRDRMLVAVENPEPNKRRGVNGTQKGFIVLAWEELLIQVRYLTRRLSPEESAELAEKRKRRELATVLLQDAKVWEGRMVNALTRMGLSYETRKEGKIIKTSVVHFWPVELEPDAIHFHVDPHRLPFGVSTDRLKDEEIVNNLGMAVGRRITCRWSVESGIWYTVERASGRAGIRNHVMVGDMWDAMPASANPLTIPVGMTHNARMVYVSVAEMPHALIAGTTGSGKSNFEHVGINTLIRRNSPDRVRLILVDLKGGLEFDRYVGVPHLLRITCGDIENTGVPCDEDVAPTGIVTERERVPALLSWLRSYGEKRMKTLKAAKCSNIGEYNAHKKKDRMPFIVVWVDEWADVRLGKGGKEAEDELVNLVQRMRAVGMHFILATQIPKSEVITGLIKGNLPCRFAFSVPNIHASMAIIDNADAVGLEPTGRCILQFRGETQIQTPFISKDLVQETIKGAMTGTFEKVATHDVTPLEVMTWALAENNGWLGQNQLWAKFQERDITQAELWGWLKEWEGNTFVIDMMEYKVQPGAGVKGRRLVTVDPTVETPAPDPTPSEAPTIVHQYHVGEELLSASLGKTVKIVELIDVIGQPGYLVDDGGDVPIPLTEEDLYPGVEQ